MRKINSEAPLLKPTNDFVFKAFFVHKPSTGKRFCKAFLESFLDDTVNDLELAPCDIYSEDVNAKDIRLDLSLLMNENTKINIEMQASRSLREIPNRSLYYASLLYCDQASKGELYAELNKVRQIFVLIDDFNKENNSIHLYEMIEKKTGNQLTDAMRIYMLELKKAAKENLDIENMSAFQKWCVFLLHGNEMDNPKIQALTKDGLFSEAVERLKEISENQRIRDMAFAREKRKMDEAQIRWEGKQEGRLEGIIHVANNLFKLCLSNEEIAKVTGLEVEEIIQLKKAAGKDSTCERDIKI